MEFRTEELAARPFVFVRVETKMHEIGEKIGEALAKVGPYVGENAAGMPVTRYVDWNEEGGGMEIGLPVRAPMEGEGDVQCGELIAGKVLTCTHVGPYDNLKQSWAALHAHIAEHDLPSRAAPWEVYADDPGQTPIDQVRTLIYWPI
ncbi:MAG: GyrI-like domain-containing protein [Planctomycetota bacterium]